MFLTQKNPTLSRLILTLTAFLFLFNTLAGSAYCASALGYMPEAGQMLSLSGKFTPPTLVGIKFYPDNPLRFDFIVDKGTSAISNEELQLASSRLIRYFLAGLTIPEDKVWVNLSPVEKDKIAEESLSSTELGRDMLGEDYILKQLTASITHPDSPLGKSFWSKVYNRSAKEFGTTRIPANTFNKIWITPGQVKIYEDVDKAIVGSAGLKVMMEADYMAMNNGQRV